MMQFAVVVARWMFLIAMPTKHSIVCCRSAAQSITCTALLLLPRHFKFVQDILQKNNLFVDFPLCSSRACLGKYSVLTIKRRLLARKGSRFSYLVLLEERIKERIVRRPRVVPKETGDHSSLSFPYVCPEHVLVK
jgi:hypothetical protein